MTASVTLRNNFSPVLAEDTFDRVGVFVSTYITEAFEAFVQALRDGYGHRGAATLRAALDGDCSGATDLEAALEQLMHRVSAITVANATTDDRLLANETRSNMVSLTTPKMMAISMVLDSQFRDHSEMLDKGRELLAQFS